MEEKIMFYISNADDYAGYQGINLAISEAFKNHLISQTTMMMTKEEFINEAISLAKENNFIDKIGVHISLSRGKPLSEKIKKTPLVGDNGYLNFNYFNKKIRYFIIPRKIRLSIEDEIECQLLKYRELGLTLNHFDSHGHIHVYPSLYKSFVKVAKKHNFFSVRLPFPNHSKNPIIIILKKRITKAFKKNFKTIGLNVLSCDEALAKKQTAPFELMTHPGLEKGEEEKLIKIKNIYNNLKAFNQI